MAQLALVRGALRAMSVVSPQLAAHVAGRFWFRIPKPPIKPATKEFLATGRRFEVAVGNGSVTAWEWGSGPAVILVHGWGGYGGQLQEFVAPVVARGRRVITFDALSHGVSQPGQLGPRHATLFEFADALLALQTHAPVIRGVVAHSGGATAVAWALWRNPKLRVERLVFIAPMSSALRYMAIFQRTLGLSDDVMRRFRATTEQRFDFRWEDLDIPRMASTMATPPTLVVHDREDRETAWQDGADIAAAWPHTEMLTTSGLGHVRILRDATVVSAVTAFVG